LFSATITIAMPLIGLSLKTHLLSNHGYRFYVISIMLTNDPVGCRDSGNRLLYSKISRDQITVML